MTQKHDSVLYFGENKKIHVHIAFKWLPLWKLLLEGVQAAYVALWS